MRCPICLEIELKMTERSGIEIDYCPKCRGVWLDRGELDKLIERAHAVEVDSPLPPPPQQHQSYRPPQGYTPKPDDRQQSYPSPYAKRRRSWLSDLFD